jgi:hypothetical protein
MIIGALVFAVGLAMYATHVSRQSQELARLVMAKHLARQTNMPAAVPKATPAVPTRPISPGYTYPSRSSSQAERPRDSVITELFKNSWGLAFDMPPEGKGRLSTDFDGKMQIATIVFGQDKDLALHVYAYSGNATRAQVMIYLFEEANIPENKWISERSPYGLTKKGFSEELMFTGKDLSQQTRYEVVYSKNKTGKFQYLFMWETSDNSFAKYKDLMRSFYNSVRGQR